MIAIKANVTLKTGGSGAVAHYGTLREEHMITTPPIFSRMGVTLIKGRTTIFIPYANLMSLEWT